VRFVDAVGLIFKVIHLDPSAPSAVTQTAQETQPAFRLFLQPNPSTEPYVPWGDWKVRPFGNGYLEVEASAVISGTPVFVVAYLYEASDHPGINSVAFLGGMLDSLFEQQQRILASPYAQAALDHSGCLRPLLESDIVDDGGLGHCMLRSFQDNSGYTESMLVWTDGQPSELYPTPHTRFLVLRTFHVALGLISELLMLQQALSLSHTPQAPTVWDQADNSLEWLDVNVARAGRILNFLADIFQ